MIQSIRKYCEGYSSSTGLTSIIEMQLKPHHLNQLHLEFPDWSESSRMDSDVLDRRSGEKNIQNLLKDNSSSSQAIVVPDEAFHVVRTNASISYGS